MKALWHAVVQGVVCAAIISRKVDHSPIYLLMGSRRLRSLSHQAFVPNPNFPTKVE